MIEVLIPSLNEAATISNVTLVVDTGLKRYFPNIPSRIINIDSNSSDGTVERFKGTETTTDKLSLVCPKGLVGKGYGIKEGLKQVQKDNAKYVLMLDADLKSISPEWIKLLLEPIIEGCSGLSAPIYTRNRYEGNGTNHFSSPLIYACFGVSFLQPIAGDFAFNREVADAVIENMQYPSDFQYGVDSVITTTALVKGHSLSQTFLGRKIHNPSFPKIKKIFVGEATSAFCILNKSRYSVVSHIIQRNDGVAHQYDTRITDEQFIVKPNEERIMSLQRDAEELVAGKDLGDILGEVSLPSGLLGLQVDQTTWINAMVGSLAHVLEKEVKYPEILNCVERLLPLYLLRVVNYFQQIENWEFQQVDQMILDQKKAIRAGLIHRLVS